MNADRAARYEIRIQGHLASHRLNCFESLAIRHRPTGETGITGSLDPAALHGLLNHLYHLGVTLLSVQRVDEGKEE